MKQKEKILSYRNLSLTTDVTDAIDEIVNEIIFIFDDKVPVKIEINEENDVLVKAVTEKFNKVVKLLDLKRNLFNIVRSGYIDGQLIFHTAYDEKSTKGGIKTVKMIDPCMFYFDVNKNVYKYMPDDKVLNKNSTNHEEYSVEEICQEDFGLYNGDIKLSYLEFAIKPANMLKTLEDLLVPMRFSRSISRRVFNVDISDLPNKRGSEIMRDYQSKFKYKKFYNNSTGEVSNQQHITSMVEDYWFANRSGGKGTTVDTIDETGNLGEIGDILYFNKKLYKALKIPSSRISNNPDADSDFSYDETRTTKEDMKFFMFISRIRQVYSSIFKEVLKREIVSTGVMSETEWDEKEDLISIIFSNENKFIEKMKITNLLDQFDAYNTAQDFGGKIMSHEQLMKKIFRFSDEEIKENLDQIDKESKDAKFKQFYDTENSGF